jgi:hypothetical protein
VVSTRHDVLMPLDCGCRRSTHGPQSRRSRSAPTSTPAVLSGMAWPRPSAFQSCHGWPVSFSKASAQTACLPCTVVTVATTGLRQGPLSVPLPCCVQRRSRYATLLGSWFSGLNGGHCASLAMRRTYAEIDTRTSVSHPDRPTRHAATGPSPLRPRRSLPARTAWHGERCARPSPSWRSRTPRSRRSSTRRPPCGLEPVRGDRRVDVQAHRERRTLGRPTATG